MEEIKRLKQAILVLQITIFILAVACLHQSYHIQKIEKILIQQNQINNDFVSILGTT